MLTYKNCSSSRPLCTRNQTLVHYVESNWGVFTLTQCVKDESEDDEAEEDHVELLESRKDATERFQSPEQPLDLVAPFVHLPVVFSRVEPGLARRDQRSEPQPHRKLACLVALVCPVHQPGQLLALGSEAMEQLATLGRIMGLSGRQRERHRRSSIRGNQMNLGGPSPAGLADGLWTGFLAHPSRREEPSRGCCPSQPPPA